MPIEAYVKLRAEYEGVIRSQNAAIKKLHKERDSFSFSRKEITRQWMDVLEDVQKEHEKEVKKLKQTIAELLDMIVSLKNRNAELDSKRKKALEDYYETEVKLEDAQGSILKLTAQVNIIMKIRPCHRPNASAVKRLQTTGKKQGRSPAARRGTRTMHANQ